MVALAVLMPIVASMGRIAGRQTLTLMIRGLALEQITKQTYMALLRKEMGVVHCFYWHNITYCCHSRQC